MAHPSIEPSIQKAPYKANTCAAAVVGRGLLMGAAMMLSSCVMPNQAQRAQDTATQLATAVRFGQPQSQINHVAPSLQAEFVGRYTGVRIVDLETTGSEQMSTNSHRIILQIGWNLANETTLRTTTLAQTWQNEKGQWLLTQEQHLAGDKGLWAKH
jgi:hypothetical protein